MRIALVVTGGFDASGRQHVIPTLLALVERLARRHDVFIYVLRYLEHPATYPLVGATVRDLGRPAGTRQQYDRLLTALRHDGPFDVLHAYWGLPAGLVTAFAGRRLNVPTVVTCDSGEFVALPDIAYGSQVRARQRLAMRLTTRLATVVTVCTQFQAGLAAAHGCSPRTIPLGIDGALFVPAVRSEGPPWRLLHVASLNPVKDHDTLLRAFQLLVLRGVDAHLDVVGEDTMAGAAPRLAAELGIANRVCFAGFKASNDLIPLYQRSHLFVLSSRHEAAGAVVLEAAASGVPVVGTSVGYIADWAPEQSVAVPTRDPAALASAVHELLQNRERRDALAQHARQWTLAHDADWTSLEFDHIYATLATPGS
jgi:glycosyltransferase involved in cell wall biosynthesis